jgi:hypothetical protein
MSLNNLSIGVYKKGLTPLTDLPRGGERFGLDGFLGFFPSLLFTVQRTLEERSQVFAAIVGHPPLLQRLSSFIGPGEGSWR